MLQVKTFEQKAGEYDEWFREYPFVFHSEVAALKMQLLKAGENVTGIQVGVGSGRFAEALGILEGVEPASSMQEMAALRGIEVIDAFAERLPYKDMHFDFVLFASIEHLDNFKKALNEAFRVLKPGGSVITGFIEKDSEIGKAYLKKRLHSHFYRHANFYSVAQVLNLLEDTGFKKPEVLQTLFGPLNKIKELQSPKEGYGAGSYVVIKAEKPE